VSPDTPAEKAGLKDGDVVVSINGKPIATSIEMFAAIQTHKPGDVIQIVVHRDDAILEKSVTLGRRPGAAPGRGGQGGGGGQGGRGGRGRPDQNRMGSELSEKSTFPTVLQHDTVIKPTDCGGPLIDLDGRVVGINVARAGRVESYALPSEIVVPLLADLMSGKSATTAAAKSIGEKVKAAREAVKQAKTEKDAALRKLAEAEAALDKLLAEGKPAEEKKDEKK
jgi:serine protease Do